MTQRIDLQGIVTYDGAGGGTFSGQALSPGTGGPVGTGIPSGGGKEIFVNQIDYENCTVTYSVQSDGSLSQSFNGCLLTLQTGPATGGTRQVDGLRMPGQVSLDGTILMLSHTGTGVETFTVLTNPPTVPPPPPDPFDRICIGSGLATSRR